KENFTGHELDDETGLIYAGARYYDSAIGRWLNVDPAADALPSSSPYAYVLNRPVSLFDPNGEFPITIQVRSFAPFNRFGLIFEGDGDNRSFTTGAASSRVRQWMKIETDEMMLLSDNR